MGILKMAWRNIGRNRRRTVVTVAAMAFGFFAMVVWFAMLQGLLADMERTVIDVEIGDLQIHAPTYLDDPSLYTRIDDVDALIAALEAAGFRASARLVGGGLAAAGVSAAGASLQGRERAADAGVSAISTRVAEGAWLDEDDPYGVVVGRRLARSLDLEIGGELIVLSQAADGSIANDLYAVRGILQSVSDGVDRSTVFLNEAAFRELFVLPSGAHRIVVRKPDDIELPAAVEAVQGLAPGLDTRSWRTLLPTLATYLDSANASMQIVSAVIYIVVAILILNAMLMAVFERIREFGVLKALGVEPRQVVWLIFVESGLQTGLALAVGVALAVPDAVVPGGVRHRHRRARWGAGAERDDRDGLAGGGDAGHVRGPDGEPGRAGAPGGDLPRPEGGPHQSGGGDAASVIRRAERPRDGNAGRRARCGRWRRAEPACRTRHGRGGARRRHPASERDGPMKGTNLATMAWRNLWRNRRRTYITLSAIVFGVFLAVIMMAMQDRNWADMIRLAARLGAGHVTIQHPEYLDTPTLTRTVQGTDTLKRLAADDPHVIRVVERITGFAMLATARENVGAGFIAVSPEQEDDETLSLIEAIVEGEFFGSSTDGGIILGERLAANLDVELGSKLVYTLTDKEGEIVSALARVSGIVRTGSPSVDAGICLLPIDAVRRWSASRPTRRSRSPRSSTTSAPATPRSPRSAPRRRKTSPCWRGTSCSRTWRSSSP